MRKIFTYVSLWSAYPLEGINRKIKQIQRTAYGYRNFEHFKARIYLQTYLGKDTRSSMKIA
ncbi:transposase [Ligilactobacillus salivarius]